MIESGSPVAGTDSHLHDWMGLAREADRADLAGATAEDRQEELQAFTLAQRAAAGASFYTLFPRD